jgi:uncharacterized protein YbjQ (UPF0145 family)
MKSIKVSTTNNLEGWNIDEYIEPISIHIAVGMNIFKDLFSGLTDIFGGKSKSYNKTLNNLQKEVLIRIKEKAGSLGANYVVGFNVDYDEISGGGKSMMMVTATGTAVIATKIKDSTSFNINKTNQVSNEKLNNLLHKELLLSELKDDRVLGYGKNLEFVTDNSYKEFINHIIEYSPNIDSPNYDNYKSKIYKYILSLDRDFVIDFLYNEILNGTNKQIRNFVVTTIIDCKFGDLKQSKKLLNNPDTQLISLKIINNGFEMFNSDDIESIKELSNQINKIFVDTSKIIESKSMLGSSKKWQCQCGEENKITNKYCKLCDKDKYGVPEGYIQPSKVISKLEIAIKLLS